MTKNKIKNKYYSEDDLTQIPAFSQFSNPEDFGQYLKIIYGQFGISKNQFDNLSGFDKILTTKIAHWIQFYAEKFSKLENEFQNLNAQYCLISTLSAIEATIGIPVGKNPVDRLFEFFNFNLNKKDLSEFTKTIQFYNVETGQFENGNLSNLCNELVSMRHGLLHRAELVNLPTEDLEFIGARGRDNRKLPYTIYNKLHPSKLLKYTRKAISSYLLSGPSRTPKRLLDEIYPIVELDS